MKNEIGYNAGYLRTQARLWTCIISLIATSVMILRFARSTFRNEFHAKLIVTLTVADLFYCLKGFLLLLPEKIGTFSCHAIAWADTFTKMFSQSWTFVLMLNLSLMTLAPHAYSKLRKGWLYVVYLLVAFAPPLVVMIGAELEGEVGIYPFSKWLHWVAYFLYFYYGFGLLTIMLSVRCLGLGLTEITDSLAGLW